MRTWRITDAPTPEELAAVTDGVLTQGRALAAAAGGDARPIACLVSEGAGIVAGASGRTEFNRLFVSFLWVAPQFRSQGLGTEMLARLESAAIDRGCSDVLIETLSDRVALLYRRLGYAPVATIRYVGPFLRHTLIKPLGGSTNSK